MTPNAQRMAIAEASGYHDAQLGYWDDDGQWIQHWNGNPTAIYTQTGIRAALPDYLNDLRAMNEAVALLKRSQCDDYISHLGRILKRLPEPEGVMWGDSFILSQAIAAQKAEALLKTLNLWTL